MTDAAYLERVYAGILGKVAGVRLGAPVEPTIWSYERIEACYGDITGYLREYKNFAADDDLNGPLFFIRALSDYCPAGGEEPTSEMVGKAWLDYARDGKGMFWWGGYGRSAEHTAYVHLKNGIAPPLSGSIRMSGPVIPQQIGGQIFIDTWGLIAPGDEELAARLAGAAAAVAHDGVGVDGARFVAAAIAVAFEEVDPEVILHRSLAVVDPSSDLRRIAGDISEFRGKKPEDFRGCRELLEKRYGYWKYPGVCPLPTNAGVIILALLYGAGRFDRTIEIATMCGWDTDCNAGNAGTIAGVAYGLESIPDRYRSPVNDVIIASSVAGSLNIVDVPTISAFVASHRYQLHGKPVAEPVSRMLPGRDLHFSFDLAGSTHGFRLSDTLHFRIQPIRTDDTADASGALEILVDRLERGQSGKVYYKPFYRRKDFDDERYDPAFSPMVYPGQAISFRTSVSVMSGEKIRMAPFAVAGDTTYEGVFLESGPEDDGEWTEHRFVIPDTDGQPVDEVGLLVMNYHKTKFLGHVLMADFTVTGPGTFQVDFSKQTVEFRTITQCTTTGGAWSLEMGQVRCCSDGTATLFTGNYYSTDYTVKGVVEPVFGESHMVVFRALGTRRAYYFGLHGLGTVALLKNRHTIETLAEKPFEWEHGTRYELVVTVRGPEIVCTMNGIDLFQVRDSDQGYEHGMVGYHHQSMGHSLFGTLTVAEVPAP